MKGKLKSATSTWKESLKSQKELREKLEEDLEGKKTRRCKQTMKMMKKAERSSRAYNKKKYSEKFKTMERTYNKTGGTGKENDDLILSQFSGMRYTDLDLSRRVKVLCNDTVKCKSCSKKFRNSGVYRPQGLLFIILCF